MKTTKIILNQDVYNLGEEGDVCDVAPGYARNFLLPKGFAVAYNKRSLSLLSQRHEVIEKRKQEKQDAAKGLKERLETMEISLEMPTGDTGRLFGSVTNAALAEYFASQGVIIERKKIIIPEHSIKMVGTTKIQVRLYGEEVAEVKVEVVPVGGKKAKVEKNAKSIAKSTGDTVEEPKSDPEDSETPADAASGEE